MRSTRNFLTAWVCPIGVLLSASVGVSAQSTDGYRMPPEEIVRILDHPPTPSVSVSPDGKHLLLSQRSSMPSIEEVAQPILRLAGRRFNPVTNSLSTRTSIVGLSKVRVADGVKQDFQIPEPARLSSPLWSPDSRAIAFAHATDQGLELWVADAATTASRRLGDYHLNGSAGIACRWAPDSRHLLCSLIPSGRGNPPQEPGVPSGPVIQQTSGRNAPVRTYQDLLQDEHDVALWKYYRTAQLAWVDVSDGSTDNIGQPAIYASVSISPDGKYLLSSRIAEPFSYLVPESRFPRVVEVLSRSGQRVKELLRQPLGDEIPIGGVATGPRSHQWVGPRDSSLIWVEALDDGDPRKETEHRDRLILLDSLDGEPREVARTTARFSGASWGEDGSAMLYEYDRRKQWRRTSLLQLDPAGLRLLWEHSAYDGYADPGRPQMRTDSRGRAVMVQDGDWILLSGRGASPRGDHPFLDRFNLVTAEKERIFQAAEGTYESVADVLDDRGIKLVTSFETKTDPPNYYFRDQELGERRALTDFTDPAPQLRGISRQLVTYEREDGVPLSGQLYLPANHQPGERLPVVVWAYPREYNDPSVAGQVRGSPNRFSRFSGSSHMFFLTQGYAVFDGPAMPVVGEDGNDTFVKQLVMNAQAAVDKVVEMGIADRDRIGIGGHSYGAFMTANLLAHSDLFKSGIARSGAYNRTLTPFGFQNERRTFWEAPEVYFAMSPFMHADKINEPILLIHGDADNNSGTFPIQSRRLYHALKGHGATARLVMLPHESHGYAARESVLHALAEMIDWFDKHVKKAEQAEPVAATRPGR